MRKFFIELENKIRTKNDLLFYLEEIDLTMELILSDSERSLSEKLAGRNVGDLTDMLLRRGEGQTLDDLDQQVFFLQLLKKYISALPQIRIEIAFRPEEATLDKISDWLKKELKEKTIIDLVINPNHVGGAVIEYKGKWKNFSLSKRIKELEINRLVEEYSHE